MKLKISDFTEVPFQAMQEVHLEEVEMLNTMFELIEGVKSGSIEKAAVTEKLDELHRHVIAHFANEERLMQENHFPPYPMHKGAHDRFLAELEGAAADWIAHQETEEIEQFLSVRLIQWMKEHINTMDYVTASYLAMQG